MLLPVQMRARHAPRWPQVAAVAAAARTAAPAAADTGCEAAQHHATAAVKLCLSLLQQAVSLPGFYMQRNTSGRAPADNQCNQTGGTC